MTEKTKALTQDEIEARLPWYVAKTLPLTEMAEIEAYIRQSPALQRQITLIEEERGEVVLHNERLGAPSPRALDNLMAQINAESKVSGASLASVKSGLFGSIRTMLDNISTPIWQFGALAAAFLIIVQMAIIGALMSGARISEGYKTASGGTENQEQGSFVLVRFEKQATVETINGVLDSFSAKIVEGPKPGGVYKIKVSDKPLTEAEKNDVIERLKKETGVVGLVMPVR